MYSKTDDGSILPQSRKKPRNKNKFAKNVMQTSLLICVICSGPYFIHRIVNAIDQTEDTAQVSMRFTNILVFGAFSNAHVHARTFSGTCK